MAANEGNMNRTERGHEPYARTLLDVNEKKLLIARL